jgi:predicted transcriptional regulator
VTANSPDRLTITLDAADRAALERLAKQTERSLAWVVREAIRRYLAGDAVSQTEAN